MILPLSAIKATLVTGVTSCGHFRVVAGGSHRHGHKRSPEYNMSFRKVNGDYKLPMTQSRIEELQKLSPNEAVRIASVLEDRAADADIHLKEQLSLIKCECGAEILLLPDLQAMNRAIKIHASEHAKKERNAKRKSNTSDKVSQLLSQLSLKRINQ